MKRIAMIVAAAIVAQQIYAHALGALYGDEKCWRAEAWWGAVGLCRARTR